MEDNPLPFVSGASTDVDRLVPIHGNDCLQNVCYTFRKKKAREAAKEHREKHKEYVQTLEKRNAILEFQNKALRDQLKKLKQLYEKDLLK